VTIYDIRGAEIEVLKNSFETSGYYAIKWNASQYASGVYLIEMLSDEFRQIKKIVHMK